MIKRMCFVKFFAVLAVLAVLVILDGVTVRILPSWIWVTIFVVAFAYGTYRECQDGTYK